MPDNPISNQISNPGASPVQPTPSYGPEKPMSGADEETQGRPFMLGPEKANPAETPSGKISPMEVAGDSARQQQQLAPEVLSDHIAKLQDKLDGIQTKITDPKYSKNFTDDHYTAMQKVTEKMNPDLKAIAENSNGKFEPAVQEKGQGALEYVVNWINGSQGALGGALDYLQTTEKPNIASYLKLQYAVQRATQKGELFASIVGSTVSGIKTIMSTQIG